MEWIVLFIINWIVFLLLVNLKKLKINILAGFFAICMAITTDFLNSSVQGRYIIHKPVVSILGDSLFFLIGPVFVIGILIAQYHPKNRWMSVINVFVITVIYSLTEYILVYKGVVEYIDWDYIDSVMVNIGAMVMISWFSMTVLKKWSG
ncbi:MAG: hypothetical protein N4A64_03465 [Marinisporobacter sp.]|jgi:hypothetical protein|nr:hypothetical protein [Marinisporobacter sp.]